MLPSQPWLFDACIIASPCASEMLPFEAMASTPALGTIYTWLWKAKGWDSTKSCSAQPPTGTA